MGGGGSRLWKVAWGVMTSQYTGLADILRPSVVCFDEPNLSVWGVYHGLWRTSLVRGFVNERSSAMGCNARWYTDEGHLRSLGRGHLNRLLARIRRTWTKPGS